jgi:hypothetical protein
VPLHVCLKYLHRHPLEVHLPLFALVDLIAYDEYMSELESI